MSSVGLPCDPDLRCQDRFDLCNSEEDEVSFWILFGHVMKNPIKTLHDLIDLLETIAISLRGTAGTDYGLLRETFAKYWDQEQLNFFYDVWPTLRELALELPQLFPTHSLRYLTKRNNHTRLSRRQVACLVLHQFLCTLTTPSWMTDGSPDFHIWYSSSTPHPKAVEAYLFSLFQYFQLLAGSSDASPLAHDVCDWSLLLEMRTVARDFLHPDILAAKLAPLSVIDKLDEASTVQKDMLLGLPGGASVISANKDVGFGRTASQEEMVVGCSPELCIVVLFQPTLHEEEVLAVEGAQAMISMTGYGREAQLCQFIEPDYDQASWQQSKWRKRRVLFMDALELDNYDASTLVADVLPGNVDRELRKAYTAFSWIGSNDDTLFRPVVTGLWGCRSFGGNKEIKTLIQWAAASMAHIKLILVCVGDENKDFAAKLRDLTNTSLKINCSISQVLEFLQSLQPEDQIIRNTFSSFEVKLTEAIDECNAQNL